MVEPHDERVDIRAPRDGEFFRVNPDTKNVVLIRDEKGEQYLIAPNMVPHFERRAPERLEHCIIFLAQNKDGDLFLWPVAQPVPDDHPAYVAMENWICIRGLQ